MDSSRLASYLGGCIPLFYGRTYCSAAHDKAGPCVSLQVQHTCEDAHKKANLMSVFLYASLYFLYLAVDLGATS
jgi:hypothetical protein